MPLRILYLLIAIPGAVVPMYFFVRWFEEFGYDIVEMTVAWAANDATRGLTWDLTIAAIALTVAVIADLVRHRDWWMLTVIPATFCVGLSFGLPIYFFLKARSL